MHPNKGVYIVENTDDMNISFQIPDSLTVHQKVFIYNWKTHFELQSYKGESINGMQCILTGIGGKRENILCRNFKKGM